MYMAEFLLLITLGTGCAKNDELLPKHTRMHWRIDEDKSNDENTQKTRHDVP